MEKIDIFKFSNYKEYLLKQESIRPRGFRALIAKSCKCQASYISQILSGIGELSPEQAENVNELLGHDETEAGFFLLMVNYDRAGTPSLQKRILTQMKKLKSDQSRLSHRLKIPSLSSEAQLIYYSSWKYAAVHVATSIPQLNSPEKLASYLAIPVSQVSSILAFLLKIGVLVDMSGKLTLGQIRLHLEDDSPSIQQHHSNWRFKAMESLSRATLSNYESRLHYSSVVTISEQDVAAIRTSLLQDISKIKSKIAKSPEETIYGFNLDFYPIEN